MRPFTFSVAERAREVIVCKLVLGKGSNLMVCDWWLGGRF